MIDMKRLDARRSVRVGDHVDYVGNICSAYAGLIVDVAANGAVIVAKPGAKEAIFDPRTLRIAQPR